MACKNLFCLLVLIVVCKCLHAQVPVYEEPLHKVVLKNEYIRLIDVHLPPGDTTQFHIHAATSVFIHFTTSMIGGQVMGEAFSQPGIVEAGYTRYTDYARQPLTHRVYSADKNDFHVMDIELMKKMPTTDSCADLLTQPGIETTINEKLVRMYKFNVESQGSLNVPESGCAHLLACITGEVNAGGKKINAGGYLFINANMAIHISNPSVNKAGCVLVELK